MTLNPISLPADATRALTAARNGDKAALGHLLASTRSYLLAVADQQCWLGVQGRREIADAVQETLVHALKGFKQFRGTTEEELRGWLRRILLNRLRSDERRRVAEMRDPNREVSVDAGERGATIRDRLLADTPAPLAELIRADKIETIQQALRSLKEGHLNVILLRCKHELSFEEMGERLGRSAEAARKLWDRACQELKVMLQAMRGDEDSDFQDCPAQL